MHTITHANDVLAQFVVNSHARSFTDEALGKAAYCILDSVGLALIARGDPAVVAVNSLLGHPPVAEGPNRAGTVWTTGTTAAASQAVFANGCAVHAQFHDDTGFSSWAHPGSLVTPVAITLAEALDASIHDALVATVVGYSVMEWLGGHDVVARALIARGLRTSPIIGSVGAAAAAAYLLGADVRRASSALSIAVAMAGGVLEPVRVGSDEWRVQNGNAARQGLLAADLAMAGIEGSAGALMGDCGFLRALAGLDETPDGWAVAPSGNEILAIVAKPWAALGDNMPAAAAAKVLFDRGVDVTKIAGVVVEIWDKFASYPGTSFRGPFVTDSQAVASLPFNVAAMLIHGDLEYGIVQTARDDARIMELVSRIDVVPRHDLDAYSARVSVRLEDGHTEVAQGSDYDIRAFHHDAQYATNLFAGRMSRVFGTEDDAARVFCHALLARGGAIRPLIRDLRRLSGKHCHEGPT